jgi:hypothetical protein
MDMMEREAIRNMVMAYYDPIWRDDIEAVVQLFSPDGTMVVIDGPVGGVLPWVMNNFAAST